MIFNKISKAIAKPKPIHRYVESGSFLIILGTACWGAWMGYKRLTTCPDVVLTRENPFPWQRIKPHESTTIIKSLETPQPCEGFLADEENRYQYKRLDPALHHPILDKIAHE